MSEQLQEHKILAEFQTSLDDLLAVLKILNDFSDQSITFEATDEGIITKLLDPSHVAMIDFRLASQMFDKYDLTDNKSSRFGFNVQSIYKKLKAIDDNQTITIYYTQNTITFKSRSTTYETPNKPDDITDTPRPRLISGVIYQIENLKHYTKQHKKLESLGYDSTTYQAKEHELILKSTDKENTTAEIVFDKEHLTLERSHDYQTSTYSLEYLNQFLPSISENFTVKVGFSSNKPLEFNLNFKQGLAYIDYWLAPRIES